MLEFQDRFIDEARDLIAGIENEVIGLESHPDDKSTIDEIFRVMHTLKGTASMFGFRSIESVTHQLESIYDAIRSDRQKINRDIINLTFAAVDIIKKILDTKDNLSQDDQQLYNDTLNNINKISGTTLYDAEAYVNQTFKEKETEQKIRGFYIFYNPDENICYRGVKPFGIFYELSDIGKYKAFPFLDKLPSIEEINLDKFYLYWDIFLVTKATPEEVNDIFMFFDKGEYAICAIDINNINENTLSEYAGITKHKLKPEEINEIFRSLLISEGIKIEMPEFIRLKGELADTDSAINEIEQRSKTLAKKTSTMRVSSEKLDHLVTNVSEFVILYSQISLLVNKYSYQELVKPVQALGKLSKILRDNALELRLVPLNELTLKLRRLVRDLSQQMGKEISFITEGTDTELDKTIINSLEDPLMHIIRNSIDHGIESKEVRQKMHKPVTGIIRFTSFYSGANVFIQIQDDGAGINPDTILKRAIEKGFVLPGQKLDKREIYDLIFLPGLTTAQKVSKLSGRGVGMDVVKQKITELRGEIEIDSEVNLGTSITIKLPLTLSIIDTLKVVIGDSLYLVPLSSVETCLRVKYTAILNSHKRQFEYESQLLPVIVLREEFDIHEPFPEFGRIIIVKQYDKKYGLLVDHVVGEHQAVVKPLGDLHKKHNFFTGVSIMGDGTLVLILDTGKIISTKKEIQNTY